MLCCQTLPLKSGIHIAAVLDLLVGVLCLLKLGNMLLDHDWLFFLQGIEILLSLSQ